MSTIIEEIATFWDHHTFEVPEDPDERWAHFVENYGDLFEE